ncbi:MAG: Zn-ribbon domain-containing OB-fold protein [Janthinobacterium lividum]
MGPEAEYRAFLKEGRFMIQRSRSTGRHIFYPRIALPGTGEQDLDWVQASGGGTVYAITVNRGREGNYNLALVDLDEGPRMMTRIDGVETVPIGTKVQARIIEEDGAPLVVFTPQVPA